jgi:hypothetical protein
MGLNEEITNHKNLIDNANACTQSCVSQHCILHNEYLQAYLANEHENHLIRLQKTATLVQINPIEQETFEEFKLRVYAV